MFLGELTDNVLQFNNATSEDYQKFFKWVTDSIKTSSESVENNGSGFGLAGLGGANADITKIDVTQPQPPRNYSDTNFVVLAAKCQNTNRPYLIKYRKTITPSEFGGYSTMSYRLVGGFQVDNSYFELSDDSPQNLRINSEELIGAPSCPCCGNQYSFAMCGCGSMHCVGNEEISTCPWCQSRGKYSSGGEGGFDVNRALG